MTCGDDSTSASTEADVQRALAILQPAFRRWLSRLKAWRVLQAGTKPALHLQSALDFTRKCFLTYLSLKRIEKKICQQNALGPSGTGALVCALLSWPAPASVFPAVVTGKRRRSETPNFQHFSSRLWPPGACAVGAIAWLISLSLSFFL